MTAYESLEREYREINHLEHVEQIIAWDEATMMPLGGGPPRANAMAALAGVIHARRTASRIGELLEQAASEEAGLGPWQKANLHQMGRSYRHATALPAELVTATQLASARCEQTWRRCRPENDWATVAPLLEEVLRLRREEAALVGETLSLAPYDAMLDHYEEGLGEAFVSEIFGDLAAFLPGFLEEVLERQARQPAIDPAGPFPIHRQEALGRRLMQTLGFDFKHGRLDVSHHPFCGGVPDDTRITTRYSEDDFVSAMMAVLHETGHALYQQGLPADWREQPVGDSRGAAVHESQSLIMEMQVCRGRAFIGHAAALIRQAFDVSDEDPAWSTDNLYRLCIRVERGFIRVDADEVTYPLHVILRFRLEKALFAGELGVAELPGAWNEGMEALVGLSPGDNLADGCMQDVHWFAGLFGYFPTYTLGALIAAQLFSAARTKEPGIEAGIADGDFGPVLGWLRKNVHGRGKLLDADGLIRTATGAPLATEAFKEHLRVRYLGD
jgi:carboxypeptidase Taq